MTDNIYTNQEDLIRIHRHITQQIIAEQIVPQFIEMLRASDMRIDNINQMIVNLTKGAEELAEAANKMATSSTQNIAMNDYLIKANIEMSKVNQSLTSLFDQEIQELRRELKVLYQEYHHLMERVFRKDESSAVSNVQITL